jgi:hypothetical protein
MYNVDRNPHEGYTKIHIILHLYFEGSGPCRSTLSFRESEFLFVREIEKE